jgi:hypothetical protein
MLKDAKGYTFREAGASETGDRHLGIDLDHQADLGLCPSYPKSHKLRVYVVRLVLESKLEKSDIASVALVMSLPDQHIRRKKIKGPLQSSFNMLQTCAGRLVEFFQFRSV